jgi:NADPH-dependent 2,4-dienoyl-CoA reductase/sulfur reductase-like enzyme/rhodanese-related sulfurtransferase
VLSPGANPIRPPLPGIDLEGIFALRTIPDSRKIRDWIEERDARRAVVVGGGFIGLEMAENLVKRDLEVTLIEMAPQLLPPLDADMADFVNRRVASHVSHVRLNDGVAGFAKAGGAIEVRTRSGARFPADLVILGIGVRPETELARGAGLEIGSCGGIRVDDSMRTSDPAIWAVGDAVEVRDYVTGEWALIPLAGPANRQGRIAAASISGRPASFRGVQGTAVCGFFGMTAALTGATERSLRRAGVDDYSAVYLHPGHHAGYYPGARPIHLKLIFRRSDGRVLGAQAVGEQGVARRIDVISLAIQNRATVYDLEDAELCYAPQYGAAKDPVNVAGMVAANILRGDVEVASWAEVHDTEALLLDVRDAAEFKAGSIPGARNIPLGELRGALGDLPRDRPILLLCGVGQRAYYACRLLRQNGFDARNLPGGYTTYRAWYSKEGA